MKHHVEPDRHGLAALPADPSKPSSRAATAKEPSHILLGILDGRKAATATNNNGTICPLIQFWFKLFFSFVLVSSVFPSIT